MPAYYSNANLAFLLFQRKEKESNMLRTVYNHPRYKKDEDAEIVNYEEIYFGDLTNRVL